MRFAAVVGLIFSTGVAPVGYAELSRAVKGTGAFYTYIGRGLGKPAGVVAAYCAVLAYAAMSVGLGNGADDLGRHSRARVRRSARPA